MAKRRKRGGDSRRKSRPKPKFRNKVEADLVDRLLYSFVALVKQGLELMLHDPSELTRKEFRKDPNLVLTAADIPMLVLWTAVGVYELPWAEFCQHVLTHLAWAELLGVQTQADLDRLSVGLDNCQARLIELAVHDGLAEKHPHYRKRETSRISAQMDRDRR